MPEILIISGDEVVEAELFETSTAIQILNALPLSGTINTWGEEVFFNIPISGKPEANATDELNIGDLAYWPLGPAFCIFYGKTPVSKNDNPRAYSPVNIIGRVIKNMEGLRNFKENEIMEVKINHF